MSFAKQASCLLLVTKNRTTNSPTYKNNDISTLLLKRSSTSSNLPGHHVFPGGSSDKADQSSEWLTYLPESELDVSLNLLDLDKKLYTYVPNKDYLSQAISLRITAIRETFEECGILLCRSRSDSSITKQMEHYQIDGAEEWREKVRKDPKEFLSLCEQHHCYPDVKRLHLISNWVSALSLPKRFDCVFFMGVTNGQLETRPDETEIQDGKWYSVNSLLLEKNILLPPAQLYELTELNNLKDFDTLCDVLSIIEYIPCQSYRPVHVNTTDGIVLVLPGDEKYAELNALLNADKRSIKANCDLKCHRGNVIHRIEYERKNIIKRLATIVIQNYRSRYNTVLLVLTQKTKL